MKVATTIGEMETAEKRCIVLEDGLVGLPGAVRFVLGKDCDDSPFHWLQCLDDPSLALAVVRPADFFIDYSFDLQDADIESLGIESADEAVVLTTITLDAKKQRVTTNLLGPIVINGRTLVGKQVVLSNDQYATKHVLFECSGRPKVRVRSSTGAKTTRKTNVPVARAA